MKKRKNALFLRLCAIVLSLLSVQGAAAAVVQEGAAAEAAADAFAAYGDENGESAAALSEEAGERLCADYLQYLKKLHSGSSYLTLSDISIEQYYGCYSGCEVVSMRIADLVHDHAIGEIEIAGYTFTFGWSTAMNFFYAYKDSTFVPVKDAYESGILTAQDIFKIAAVRGDILQVGVVQKGEIVRVQINKEFTIPSYYVDENNRAVVKWSTVKDGEAIFIAPETTYYALQKNEKYFTDVPSADCRWAEEYLRFVTEREIMIGVGDGIFSPGGTMTRGMFVTVLANLHGAKKDAYQEKNHPFTDVNAGAWYEWAVAWAAENGIVVGTGDGKFNPEAPVTREQMAVILSRYSKYAGIELPKNNPRSTFTDDVQISNWARTQVYELQELGILLGRPDHSFDPGAQSNRAEICAVIYRFVNAMFS